MSARDVAIVLGELDREVSTTFGVIALTDGILEQAVLLARRHALRGADAVQLACALSANQRVVLRPLIVLSSDAELNAAATAEGLVVIDPTV